MPELAPELLSVVRVRMEAPPNMSFAEFPRQLRAFTTLVTTLQESSRWSAAPVADQPPNLFELEEAQRRQEAARRGQFEQWEELRRLTRGDRPEDSLMHRRPGDQGDDAWATPEGVAASPPQTELDDMELELPDSPSEDIDYLEERRQVADRLSLAQPLTLRQDVAYRRRAVERDLQISTLSYGSPIDLVVGTTVDEVALLLTMFGAMAKHASNLRRHFSDNAAARSVNNMRSELADMITSELPFLRGAEADPGMQQAIDTLLKIEQIEVLRQRPGTEPPALPSGTP